MIPLLQVYDIHISISFYTNLGFKVLNQNIGEKVTWVMLGLDNLRLMLNTLYEEGGRPLNREMRRQEIHGDTILFFNCDCVDLVYSRMIELGFELDEPVVRDYGMKQLYVSDPDGYSICFQEKDIT